MDDLPGLGSPAVMSDRLARIVYARPPSKNPPPRRAPAARKPVAVLETSRLALTSPAALQAFHDLIQAWRLPPVRAWRMLTGVTYAAGSLTADQMTRVEHLVAIDAGLRGIGMDPAAWMVTGNPTPLLAGSVPVDYLTRTGTRGYDALARQVDRWARL